MENPEARICCGPHDCGPLRIYDGTAEEISTGGWQVTIPPGTHQLVPGGDTRVFREGGRGPYTSQRLAPYVFALGRQSRSGERRFGGDGVSTVSSRCSPSLSKKNKPQK